MKQRYTLVELLVVIIIIGILAGLLIPAIGSARQTAREHACASGCMTLMQALKSFESDYQKFPVDLCTSAVNINGKTVTMYTPIGGGISASSYAGTKTIASTDSTSTDEVLRYDYTMAILTGYYGGKSEVTEIGNSNFGRNRKKTRYIEPPEEYLKVGTSVNGGTENGFYANSFGERYSIVFDSNGYKKMSFYTPNSNGGTTPKTIVGTVGVFCKLAPYDTTDGSLWKKPERIATSWSGVVAAE